MRQTFCAGSVMHILGSGQTYQSVKHSVQVAQAHNLALAKPIYASTFCAGSASAQLGVWLVL